MMKRNTAHFLLLCILLGFLAFHSGCWRDWSIKGSSFPQEKPPDRAVSEAQEQQREQIPPVSTPSPKATREVNEISQRAEELRKEAERLAQEATALREGERLKEEGEASSTRGEGITPSREFEQAKESPAGSLSVPDLSDIFFAYDQSLLSEEAQRILKKNAEWLRVRPEAQILIEGHCDERGTVEYNLALGERRAQSVKDYLVNLGISKDRLLTISYGKEKPFAFGHTEEAWAQNRRAHFLLRSP